eukprot:CAMPEP_0118850548 /NCGR_PEP_ID=MMETSP1163-20130328/354_1 /TAXON_ID=124430 /ORGANISM="Phaeomonas parva, Strain CCMP2877" /LENGTH=40 /DNA_ID= /DNA_START= /DNA_END= /DNA_ORIENTATION=
MVEFGETDGLGADENKNELRKQGWCRRPAFFTAARQAHPK